MSNLLTSLIRRTPEAEAGFVDSTPKHLGWLMLTALGIGATIGAGIFVMPGRIAEKAGPAGILSFVITGAVFLFVGICYERFARKVPSGVSAYSYVYHSIGEIFAWIVAFGLFLEYSFGASAVAIGWSQYLKKWLNYQLPEKWMMGPVTDASGYTFGVNVVALCVVALVTVILIVGGVTKSAKLNFVLVCLKCGLLALFMCAGLKHLQPNLWHPFMPKGFKGVMEGAAIAVFPYVGFDALYTFAREARSSRDTKVSTYACIGLVAFLYVTVMAIATGLAPVFPNGDVNHVNPLFKGVEASAPLASLLMANGEDWAGKLISIGAVIGIFNVLLVLSMGGPRIFRNMAEDGLLPPIFAKTRNGNPVVGVILNGVVVGGMAGFVPFETVTDIMVLGTLVAFIFVCLGALRMKLVNPVVPIIGAVGCAALAMNLEPLVRTVYCITCPIGLVVYFAYGYRHSKLRTGNTPTANTMVV